VSVSVAV